MTSARRPIPTPKHRQRPSHVPNRDESTDLAFWCHSQHDYDAAIDYLYAELNRRPGIEREEPEA